MAGFDSPYIPGWDCHGLPIEIKVDEKLSSKKLEMPAVAVRRACGPRVRAKIPSTCGAGGSSASGIIRPLGQALRHNRFSLKQRG